MKIDKTNVLTGLAIVHALSQKETVDIKDLDETTGGSGSTGDYFSYWPWNSDRCEYQTSGILQWHSSSQCPVAGSSNKKADENT